MLQTTPCVAVRKSHGQPKSRSLAFAGRGLKAFQRGFSLVEIALVLLIAGVALGAGVSVLSARFTQAKIDTTKARAESIRVALTNYVGQNSRLPCPADPQIIKQVPPGNYNRAMPDTGASCTSTNSSFLNIGVSSSLPLGVSRGTVPCATLGIADEACTDGYGNRFTYFVDNRAVLLTSANVSGMQGSMTVHKIVPPASATSPLLFASQINACSPTPGDNKCNLAAVAMVISHGANNGGAFPPGTATPYANTFPEISPYEKANTDNDIQFIQNEYIERGDYSFDDVVVPLVPRDLISTLNQTGIVKQPSVLMNERFSIIKLAILNQMFNRTPAAIEAQGATPDRGLLFAPGSGSSLAQSFPASVAQTLYCPLPITNDTLQLPTEMDVQPLSVSSGLRLDVWGTPIRYKLFATNGIAKSSSSCTPLVPPPPPIPPPTKAHFCAPLPNDTIRSGLCQTAFVLVSYGPNLIADTGAVTDDDIFYPVTNQEVADFVRKSGGW